MKKLQLGDIVQMHPKSFAGKTEGVGNFLGTICEIDEGLDLPDPKRWTTAYKVFLEDNLFDWAGACDMTHIDEIEKNE